MQRRKCESCGAKLDPHGRALPQADRLIPSVAVDAGVFRRGTQEPELLLIRRGHPPFQHKLAFPGGFVDYNEDPAQAVLRELQEECALRGDAPQLVAVTGTPGRDPRRHVISILYYVPVSGDQHPRFGDDAADARFVPLSVARERARAGDFAFDHAQLLDKLLQFMQTHALLAPYTP